MSDLWPPVPVELKITGEVASLHLEPGDRIIVTITDERALISHDGFVSQLRDTFKEHFPDNEVIVVHGLSIAREPA